MSPASAATRAEAARLVVLAGARTGLDGEWASDHWRAERFGVSARRGAGYVSFEQIAQGWLREPVKRWSRFRLATGCSFTTIAAGALALGRFSRFLAEAHPQVDEPAGITRPLLEDFLAWLLEEGYSASTRALTCSMVRVFFDACHRHDWLAGLAPAATIYVDELPFHHQDLARFIPEYVMAQIEPDAALAQMQPVTAQNLLVLIIETGLRRGDACNLVFNPLVDDSTGWPCLRFDATKVRAEQLVPLSVKAAKTIRAQQDHVRQLFPGGSPWLFPGLADNADGSKPYSHSYFSVQLRHWCERIGLHDEAGQPIKISAHQFRHTFGTRLINSGVPQHVVQHLLGHASPNMTGHYARVHDTTVRQAFDAYQATRVNIAGEHVAYDPDAPTASAEWVKQNLNRVRDSLPNGYCARPAQQDCPHPNACLTCPDFQTTVEFLDTHRSQAATNRRLLEQAESRGQVRLAENLRQVQANLDRIVPALEVLEKELPGGRN